jgi:hypothetical protein
LIRDRHAQITRLVVTIIGKPQLPLKGQHDYS